MIDKCLAAKKRRLMQWVLPITYDVDFLIPSLTRVCCGIYYICTATGHKAGSREVS